MEFKDIKSIRRRVKRLRNVYLALGIIISFVSDLGTTKVKSPFSIAICATLVKLLEELRQKVILEQEYINCFFDNVNRFGSDLSKSELSMK